MLFGLAVAHSAHADPAHDPQAHADPAHEPQAHADPAHESPAHADPAHESPAHADPAHDAQALAERAVAHIHDVGREQAFADFTRPDGGFVDGELYIFCQDVSGVVVAHGGNPKIVGRNMADVRGPDGRLANVEINQLGLSQGSGWLEFRWPNPATKRIELKAAYVLKVDDHTVCGSGYYKGASP